MTLRSKLLLSQLPLVVALLMTVLAALYAAIRFGSAPGEILHENFRSFDAMRGMVQATDAIDHYVVSKSRQGDTLSISVLAEDIAAFERDLGLQESNITEAGEMLATQQLRDAWEVYLSGLQSGAAGDGLVSHEARSRALRNAVDKILQMNRNAMRRKSERAQREATRIGAILTMTAISAFLLAVLLSGAWIRRTLAPVRVLERAVVRLSEGDFEARIRIEGSDEIASLSMSFNTMASRLAQYKQSSLGELLEANSRLESVMDSLADAVVVYDLDGAPIANNEVATRVFGNRHLRLELLPEALRDAARDAFDRVRRSGDAYEPTSIDAAVELPGQPSPRWLLVSATPVRSPEEVLSGVTLAMRDVTPARRLEGFKGDLVAAAAHELRTPLTSLHMAVHLCLEGAAGPLTLQQEDLLSTARQDCERLQAVVEELLEMARLESGVTRLSRSRLNVAEFLRDAEVRHLAVARQRGKTLEVVPGDSLLAVHADSSRLARVLDNLIENAFLHAGDGGRVAIGFQAEGDSVRIFVDDSGPGVPPKWRERVFSKFFRIPGTVKQGSGLGLSIVEEVVRAHEGEVGVETSPLGGARFWLSIPTSENC